MTQPTPPQTRANRDEILRALDVLTMPGAEVELRAIDVQQQGSEKPYPISKCFTDPHELANEAFALDSYAKGIYVTLNPLKAGATGSTADTDIALRRWFPVDVDPKRPANTAASDVEHEGASRRAAEIRTFLAGLGWPEPVEADSGNGAHLLYRIALPNDDASRKLIQSALKALDYLFSGDRQNVDTTVHNAARVWKLYGTVARKGDNSPDRPHRMARLAQVPEHIQVVTREQLEALAAMLPDRTTAVKDSEPSGKALDAATWLAEHDVEVESTIQRTDCTVYRLVECPWADEHSDGVDGAAVIQLASGALVFKCYHAHCAERGWRDFRVVFEPDAYNKIAPSSTPTALTSPQSMAPELELSDTGNAHRLAEQYSTQLKFVPEWGWLAYTRGKWVRNADGHAMQAAQACVKAMLHEAAACADKTRMLALMDHARRSLSEPRLHSMLKLARYEPRITATLHAFDADPMLLNALNGTLDLRTGALRPHNPADLLTKQAHVEYDPTAQAPRWLRFIDEVFEHDTDLMAYVQRALGYALTGSVQEHAFFTCYGSGANGKSTLLGTVMRILGDYAKPLKADALLSSPYANGSSADPEIAALVGARFVTAPEPRGGALDTSRVKELTGGDPMQVRELHKMPFTLVPQFKIWMSTNERPQVPETTRGIWRRIHLIPFAVSFEGRKEEGLSHTLAAEASYQLLLGPCRMRAWLDVFISDPT